MNTSTINFANKPDPAVGKASAGANDPRHVALVHQTEKWVAQSFYGTLLKQMRDDPFRNSMMDGGRGGQAFGELFDQHIAERMSRKVAPGLVRSIVHKIEGPRAAAHYKSHSKNVPTAAEAQLRRLSGDSERSAASFARFNVTAP